MPGLDNVHQSHVLLQVTSPCELEQCDEETLAVILGTEAQVKAFTEHSSSCIRIAAFGSSKAQRSYSAAVAG